jgi:uncharacterized protein
MTTDDLSAPLGLQPRRRRRNIKIPVPQIIVGALVLFLGVFVLWAVLADDPFGGEPIAVVPANLRVAAKPADAAGTPPPTALADAGPHHDAQAAVPATAPASAPTPAAPSVPANSTTVTIINGETGTKQDVLVPGPANAATPVNAAAPAGAAATDSKFVEMTAQGPVPKIAADGTRPADAFARPVQSIPGKPDTPRVALIVGGLGVSTSATAAAIAKLPGPVTLGFVPYGTDVASLVSRARWRPRGLAASADGTVPISG